MGTRTRILTAAVAIGALVWAVPVAAQDQRPQHLMVMHDNDIDGPSATAAAAVHELHTEDLVDVVKWADNGIMQEPDPHIDCVITVGGNADELAAIFGPETTTVTGADRYATAGQIAAALDDC